MQRKCFCCRNKHFLGLCIFPLWPRKKTVISDVTTRSWVPVYFKTAQGKIDSQPDWNIENQAWNLNSDCPVYCPYASNRTNVDGRWPVIWPVFTTDRHTTDPDLNRVTHIDYQKQNSQNIYALVLTEKSKLRHEWKFLKSHHGGNQNGAYLSVIQSKNCCG